MRWVGHIPSMREKMHAKFWSEIPKVRYHKEDLGIDGKITLD
jgi:hypothetical protein